MAQKKNFKRDKYEDRILGEVNSILRAKIADARLQFVSITKVELNKDYSVATLYWDTFSPDQKEGANAAIESIAGRVRSILAKSLDVRAVPAIEFKYDAQFEAEKAIDDLLKSESKAGRDFN